MACKVWSNHVVNWFKINECDKCVYIKDTPNQEVILCLYVNDILIMSKDIANIKATKHIGIKILKTPNGLTLSQTHYIQKILEKFKFLNFKRAKRLQLM